ncbi:hypothetical protein CCHR01_16803 [Colletotrichum chrysophilum]|uniref:Fungal N-terminal domain-containing protein n=1 Tax=Colletotrichum chrysophilum TaxID=1836956 RepID=A0AAD9A3U5_9PEZI|nr:hypothetical protein CCHR01_16803 [Colletotrichum chrysophilum]
MDGLSAAASIVGVISLAMQLSQATRKLITFLDTVKEAPHEINRLKELLQLVYSMAIGVVNALEYQRKRLGDLAPGYNHLHDVLAVCLRRISSIQDITGKSHISQTQGNLSLKSWARLRLSLKGEEILELERQLGLSLQVLNVSLTTSLFYNDLPLAHGKEMTDVSYFDGDTAAEVGNRQTTQQLISAQSRRPPNTPIASERVKLPISMDTSSSHAAYSWPGIISACFEINKRRRMYRSACGTETIVEKTNRTYRITPVFLSASIEFTIQQLGGCSPTYGLRVHHVLSYRAFRMQIFPVLKYGRLKEFLAILDEGVCTINSTVADTGQSIVSMADILGNTEIGRFLHSQGCNFELFAIQSTLTRKISPGRFGSVISRLDFAEYTPEQIVLRPDLDGHYDGGLLLDAIEWFMSVGLQVTILPHSEYLGSLLPLQSRKILEEA